MFESIDFQSDCSAMPPLPRRFRPIAAGVDRRDVEANLAAVHKQIRKQRRAKFYGNLLSFWPVVLGIVLSFYAPELRDLAGGFASLPAKLLFPLSALAALHEIPGISAPLPALSQLLLYAQFPFDGLLAFMLLRQRSGLLNICSQVMCFHIVFLLCIGIETGSLSHMLN